MPVADAPLPLSDGECEAAVCAASPVRHARSPWRFPVAPTLLPCLIESNHWCRRREGVPASIVLTVDHRLRPGLRRGSPPGRRDRLRVPRTAGESPHRGRIPCRGTNVEANARNARYAMLTAAAREFGATHLITAHHQDDQAETVLMRIQRGAGVFGLAAMRPMVACGDVTVFRPFLGVPRARLAATSAAGGFRAGRRSDEPRPAFSQDPCARSDAGACGSRAGRRRTRRNRRALCRRGSGDRRIRPTYAHPRERLWSIAWRPLRLARADFRSAPEEVRLRLLSRLLMAAGGAPYPPRFRRLSQPCTKCSSARKGNLLKRTLAGVTIESRRDAVLFYREAGRGGLKRQPIRPGVPSWWDQRFRVCTGCRRTARPDHRAARRGRAPANRPHRPPGVPIAALVVQPGIWRGRSAAFGTEPRSGGGGGSGQPGPRPRARPLAAALSPFRHFSRILRPDRDR